MNTEKKVVAERTQRAVRDEWWSDERILSFLALETTANESVDYHILLKAYRGMVPEAFERFIEFFTEAGRNLNEAGPDGNSVLHVMSQHKHAEEYLQILRKAGAK